MLTTAEKYVNSNRITKETRQGSYISRPVSHQREILEALKEYGDMIPRQIADVLGYMDAQIVRPRLTELKEAGLVEVVGKARDPVTGKNVARWRAVENNQ